MAQGVLSVLLCCAVMSHAQGTCTALSQILENDSSKVGSEVERFAPAKRLCLRLQAKAKAKQPSSSTDPGLDLVIASCRAGALCDVGILQSQVGITCRPSLNF